MKNKIKLLLGAALALLVTLGMAPSAMAQGDIVFYAPVIATNISRKSHTETYTTNNQILTMNADGSNVRQLTFGNQNCFHPSWRPGRTHILFFRNSDTAAASDLWCMNFDGSGEFVVAAGAGNAGADWSPAGDLVCYPGRDATGQWGLLVVSVDPSARGKGKVGTPVLVWNGGNAYGPAWSHDGNRIAFSSYPTTGGTPYLTVLDLTTGTANTLDLAHSLLPSWSPTDDRLAFVSGAGTTNAWQLFMSNPDLSEITQVTDYNTPVLWPSWSPDGTQMAFRIGAGQNWDASIYKLTLATGELTLLRENADHSDWNP